MQTSLVPVYVDHELDSSFGGKDLKRIAKCDDGRTYALKRLEDHYTLPLCEWVGYHLCRVVGIRTPDFSIVHFRDEKPPAFGSRILLEKRQIIDDPLSYNIANFFGRHLKAVSSIYAIDSFFINTDRHGRNFMIESEPGEDTLLAFDFSRAWLLYGEPFGNQEALRDCTTSKWWKTFKKLKAVVDHVPLEKIESLSGDWLEKVILAAPQEWSERMNIDKSIEFWKTEGLQRRINFCKLWL
jgi:hypothetical protein